MDEIEQQIMFEMSEQLQEQKQSTETIKFQIEKLVQSQAKLIQSQKNLETMMTRFFSQTSIPLRPPSQPPDPLDFDKSNLKSDCTFLHEVESFETSSLIQQIEPNDVKDVISTNLILSDGSNPEEESHPEKASTHKADLDFGEETIISNTVPSHVSLYHLPVFDGTLPDSWIAKVDRFFELNQYGNEEKLYLISLSLEGAPLKWFRRHRREFTDWTDIKCKLMARFGLVKGCSPPEVLPKEKFITKVDQDTDFGSEKESTNTVEITSIKGHEVKGTTVSHLATSCVDNSVVENLKKLAWKDETPVFEHLHEPSRLFGDESQGTLGGSPLERVDEESSGDVKFHLKHKWRSRVLQTLSGLEFCLLPTKLDLRDWPKEESKPHKKKSHQIETCEVLSSLEPSRRSHNEQLGDKKGKNSILSGKIAVALARKKCMVSKVGRSTFDLECDQTQFNNKEEFMGLTESSELRPSREFLLMNFGIFMNPQLLHDRRIIQALLVGIVGTKEKLYDRLSLANYVWKPGELLCVQDQWDWISEVHSGELQEWNDVVAGYLLFDMVEKGNYLDEVIEEAAKTFTLTMIDEHKDIKTACVFLEMSLNGERLIQLGAPAVFSDWLCAMNRIQVRLKMLLLQEFLWLILFSSKMFKSSYVPQNKNQTNQKLSSYWKLLLRLLYPLHNNEWRSFYMLMIKSAFKGKEKTVSFNIAVTSCSRFGFFSYSSWMGSHNSYDLSSCVLRQEKNYVMALFPIGEALTLANDQHTLVAQKKGTETSTGCCYGFHADLDLMADVTAGTADISMDEFSPVCKLLFGVFVLNLIADQVRDWSFFGLLLQWKWHPPPQATSEFHQAHNDKPVFHL